MTVTLNDAVIERRLLTDRGLAAVVARVGRAVERRARQNVSGSILNIRSGDLIESLFVREGIDGRGVFVEVGANAVHRGFDYPAYLDEQGFPWLSDAVADTIGPRVLGRVG